MSSSTISRNNQTTIPKEVRKKLGLNPGDRIEYEFQGDLVILKAVPSALDVFGVLKVPVEKQHVPIDKARKAARDAWVQNAK